MGNFMAISVFVRMGLMAALACMLSVPLTAQEVSRPQQNMFVIGGGVGLPAGDLEHLMSSAALIRVGYGYRFRRFFQADSGLDAVVGAAGINISRPSLVGELRIRDFEYMACFGGRAILPLAEDRLELFAGGGGAYLRYNEEAEIPGLNYYGSGVIDVPCPGCASRSGWGYYGTAGFNVALEQRHRVWLGVEARYIKGATSGNLLGTGARFKTEDQWLNTSLNLAVRF